ncbi:MAG: hypothetical protein ABSF76_07270 [Opitutaceae bacterium]|jgi:hypothetical protein
MSQLQNPAADLSPAEADLGKAIVLLHRVAGRIDDLTRREEVQAVLRQAAGFVESARRALEVGSPATPLGLQRASTSVEAPIVAIIAAAVSVYLDRPYRLVSVQQVSVPVVSHLNVWAVEGRTQIFMSHRVR